MRKTHLKRFAWAAVEVKLFVVVSENRFTNSPVPNCLFNIFTLTDCVKAHYFISLYSWMSIGYFTNANWLLQQRLYFKATLREENTKRNDNQATTAWHSSPEKVKASQIPKPRCCNEILGIYFKLSGIFRVCLSQPHTLSYVVCVQVTTFVENWLKTAARVFRWRLCGNLKSYALYLGQKDALFMLHGRVWWVVRPLLKVVFRFGDGFAHQVITSSRFSLNAKSNRARSQCRPIYCIKFLKVYVF